MLLARTDAELQRFKLKCKCDSTDFVSMELLEQAKKRHALKLAEHQQDLSRVQFRADELEKAKQRFKIQLDEAKSESEELKANILYLDRKQKVVEKSVNEWRDKYNEKLAESEAVQNALIKNACEINKLKGDVEEAEGLTALVLRENKNLGDANQMLAEEIRALREAGTVWEKAKSELSAEKALLESSLAGVRKDLQAIEVRKAAAFSELTSFKQEAAVRMGEKEEEILNVK